MANKKLKDKWLGARVDEDLSSLVEVYIDAADMTMGDLVRKAVKEYMNSHPTEPSQLTKVTTIGSL
jgi:hypothetical protein